MRKKFNFKLASIAIVIAILGIGFYSYFTKVSAINNIDANMESLTRQKVQDWIAYYEKQDLILRSSSPYAYIENEKFEEIKKLGPEYLPRFRISSATPYGRRKK